MNVRAPRIMIAATASGVGKTVITCGLLRALRNRGLRVQACKCGPDYLDPMFHERVLGVPSRNLDLFLGSTDLARALVAEGAREADVTLIEGVMGYYDGLGTSDEASAYQVACATQTPVVLVMDGRGRALSVAAEVAGFARFRTPSQVVGVILNRVSDAYAPRLAAAIKKETGLPVLGYLPKLASASLESRHLGLVSAHEVDDLRQRVDEMAETLERTVDVDALLALAGAADDLVYQPFELPGYGVAHEECGGEESDGTDATRVPDVSAPLSLSSGTEQEAQHASDPHEQLVDQRHPTIAAARDAAFSFYYADSLALLERLGARVVLFSPLADAALPLGTCGLYLGGGYPELYARELSQNAPLLAQLREAIAGGLPTIAECGGFMYLQQELQDTDGIAWPMVGALQGRSWGCGHLVRFGYATLTARRDTLLARKGEMLSVHEFHYWDSTDAGDAFHACKPQSSREWDCVVATDTLHAGYPHLYLPGCPQAAQRFVDACAAYGRARGEC